MDITSALTPTTNTTATTQSPELDTETPTRIPALKPLPFSNGVLKRHHPPHHQHHHHHFSAPPLVITYKECLKNHAASKGGHALDGCGEFMPSPSATPTDPTSLKCAACGCHRNFHRRDPEDSPPHTAAAITATIEYQPHHRHHPPPPPQQPLQPSRSPNSESPPPISSSYYPSAPHMLLALSGGVSAGLNESANMNAQAAASSPRKRFRTKFTSSQKEKMLLFAEKVGWKIQKRDEDLVQEFCSEIGVGKGVLKVWMHNNKNTFAKRDVNGNVIRSGTNDLETSDNNNNHDKEATTTTTSDIHNNSSENVSNHHQHHPQNHNHHIENDGNAVSHAGTNGSSSSS